MSVEKQYDVPPSSVGERLGFWPEAPRTLRIAAERLRVLTGKPDNWTDLDRLADLIEKSLGKLRV